MSVNIKPCLQVKCIESARMSPDARFRKLCALCQLVVIACTAAGIWARFTKCSFMAAVSKHSALPDSCMVGSMVACSFSGMCCGFSQNVGHAHAGRLRGSSWKTLQPGRQPVRMTQQPLPGTPFGDGTAARPVACVSVCTRTWALPKAAGRPSRCCLR